MKTYLNIKYICIVQNYSYLSFYVIDLEYLVKKKNNTLHTLERELTTNIYAPHKNTKYKNT